MIYIKFAHAQSSKKQKWPRCMISGIPAAKLIGKPPHAMETLPTSETKKINQESKLFSFLFLCLSFDRFWQASDTDFKDFGFISWAFFWRYCIRLYPIYPRDPVINIFINSSFIIMSGVKWLWRKDSNLQKSAPTRPVNNWLRLPISPLHNFSMH